MANPRSNAPSDPTGVPDAIGPHDENQRPGGVVSGGDAGQEAAVNLDDDELGRERGNNARTGGTAQARGGDSGRLGPPSEQLSDSIGPSDPDAKRNPL